MNKFNNHRKIHIATLIVLGIILKSTSSIDSSLLLTLPLKPELFLPVVAQIFSAEFVSVGVYVQCSDIG